MDQDKFILAVAALKRAAPREWAAFMEQYNVYVRWLADRCVAADEGVGIAQGCARQGAWLKGVFDKADKRADRIKK